AVLGFSRYCLLLLEPACDSSRPAGFSPAALFLSAPASSLLRRQLSFLPLPARAVSAPVPCVSSPVPARYRASGLSAFRLVSRRALAFLSLRRVAAQAEGAERLRSASCPIPLPPSQPARRFASGCRTTGKRTAPYALRSQAGSPAGRRALSGWNKEPLRSCSLFGC